MIVLVSVTDQYKSLTLAIHNHCVLKPYTCRPQITASEEERTETTSEAPREDTHEVHDDRESEHI